MEAFCYLPTSSPHPDLSFLWPKWSSWNRLIMSLSQVIPFNAYSSLSRGNPPWCQGPFCSRSDGCPSPWLISCAPCPPQHTLCSARLSMLIPSLLLFHVFAHAAPSYWNALAPTSSPNKFLPTSSSIFSSSLQTFLYAFHDVPISTFPGNLSPWKATVHELVCLPCWLGLFEGRD